jgi:hypothetical protein
MLKKAVVRPVLCLAALTILCGTLLAAHHHHSVPQAVDTPSPKLKTIFSNLGPRNNPYDCANGWIVSGPNSSYGSSQWIAMPFVPKANSTVTEIKIAVEGPGTGGFTLTLNVDSSGLPGRALHTWEIKNPIINCITLDTVTYNRGIRISRGKQYWVVARTDSTNQDAVNAWDFVFNDAIGPFAYDLNNAGWTADNSNLSAFAVYGR